MKKLVQESGYKTYITSESDKVLKALWLWDGEWCEKNVPVPDWTNESVSKNMTDLVCAVLYGAHPSVIAEAHAVYMAMCEFTGTDTEKPLADYPLYIQFPFSSATADYQKATDTIRLSYGDEVINTFPRPKLSDLQGLFDLVKSLELAYFDYFEGKEY